MGGISDPAHKFELGGAGPIGLMKSLPLVFCGIFLTLAGSWAGIVLLNHIQLGALEPTTQQLDPETGGQMAGEERFPRVPLGEAQQGKSVYISMGCLYCHTQQVRRKGFGADYERNWGSRQSVPRDYIRQQRVLLGSMRTGPDLMTVGQRISDRNWHHLHLYDPRITSAGSTMPGFAFLYEQRPVERAGASPHSLLFPPSHTMEEGFEVVPTRRAQALVSYLLSLKLDYDLPEAVRE